MLNREDILLSTNNGKDVFKHYLQREPRAGYNFQNPFVEKQQTPSFNLFQDAVSKEWRYKDFATDDKGSWLDLVMNMHQLTMTEALSHITQELNITGATCQLSSAAASSNHTPHQIARRFHATYREFTAEDLGFWQQYGINAELLEQYEVRAVECYTAFRQDGTDYTINSKTSNPIYAYNAGDGFVKLYTPLADNKAHKFLWPTGKPAGYLFGLAQLKAWQPFILLAAGEKDTMALSAHGYPAVTVGSENALISTGLIDQLKSLCNEILICYDADQTGRNRSCELALEHGLRFIEWPPELEPHGKDAADFYRAVNEQQLPYELLQAALSNAKEAPQDASTIVSPGSNREKPLPSTFPPRVYDNLPDFLKRSCSPFQGHDKAVMLVSTLGVLSGCFPSVGGVYAQRRHSLNLFTFITAPAASGKGTMAWAQHLARPYHKYLLNESHTRNSMYESDPQIHNKNRSSAPSGAPPRRMLFLPGDTTAAALMKALADNEGRGIICESEADTLTSAMGGEHGKFGDKLCKIFHHEPVPLMRKGDNLYLEIERPAVSIVLTGTPAQLPRLMPNAENGLMSRFLFYSFQQPHHWRSGAPNGRAPLEPFFDALSEELSQMITATLATETVSTGQIDFILSQADWQRFDTTCEAGLEHAVSLAGNAGASSSYRLGLIAFRVIGLLTVLRCFENGGPPTDQVEADPRDVTTALLIMETALAHALHILATLPNSSKDTRGAAKYIEKAEKREKAHQLHAQGQSVRDIAAQVGASKSSVQEWLSHKTT